MTLGSRQAVVDCHVRGSGKGAVVYRVASLQLNSAQPSAVVCAS